MTSDPLFLSSIDDSPSFSKQEVVMKVIETHFTSLQTGIRVMVARTGLAEGSEEIDEMSNEILQSTAEAALRYAETYNPDLSSRAWLQKIAANKIYDMHHRNKYDAEHTQFIEDAKYPIGGAATLSEGEADDWTAEEQFDAILYHSNLGNQLQDAEPALEEMLSLVDENDRKILTLVYVERLNGTDLSAVLGIREGAAYMRVARAKEHLREKYLAIMGKKEL